MVTVYYDGVYLVLNRLTDDNLRDMVKYLETVDAWLGTRVKLNSEEEKRLREVRAAWAVTLHYIDTERGGY